MAGFDNDVIFANNVDFSGGSPVAAKVLLDGELLIGATASPNIRVNTLTAGTGISITNGAGTITITNTGGGGGGGGTESLAGDSGSATEVGGVINVIGGTNITTTGSGQTLTVSPTGNLLALAGLAGTGYVVQTGVNTFAERTFLSGAGITLSNADGVAGATTITASATVPTSITSDSGTATPSSNNLNIFGGTGIDTSGAGATLTVTFDVTEVTSIATSYATDSGTATPAANILTVTGGTGCATTGAGSTVTVNVDASVPLSFPTDSGTATPAANALTISGGTGCSTTGAGSTVTVNIDATVPLSFPADTGMATPAGNALTISGGTGCSTTGVGSTITVNVDASVPLSFAADVGSATPAVNTITMTGGVGIATTGAGAAVTFDLDGPVALQYTTDSGTAIPSSNNLNVLGNGSQGVSTSGSGSTVTVTVSNATTASKGVASFNSSDFTISSGAVSLLGTGAIKTLTPDVGGAVSPTSNNINILGYDTGSFDLMNTHNTGSSTIKIENRTWLTPLVVDPSSTIGARGTYATIAAALTAASSGQTIFIRSGTYTEDLTLKAGVNICAFSCDAYTPNVIISGKCTFTTAGTVTISGIRLQTNSDFAIAVTGSAASILNLVDCFINALNNTAISFTSSSSSSQINIMMCNGKVQTTGITLYTHSSSGSLFFDRSYFENSGSTTNSTISSGSVFHQFTYSEVPVTTSGTAGFTATSSHMSTFGVDQIILTAGGSGSHTCRHSTFKSFSTAVITITSNVTMHSCNIETSNTTPITGAGSLTYSSLVFSTSTSSVSTTTQVTRSIGPRINLAGGCEILSGSGSPNGSVTAPKGSLYLRTDGTTTNNRAYINTNAGTTWTAITTVA